MKEERLYIVGYMACGKSTFGRALASRIGWDFIDLDLEIERRYGKTVAQIMGSEGEERFRIVESAVLKETASRSGVVVACGGGTPCYRDNMEFMTLHGLTLWLVASPERLMERIREAGDTRPLLSGKSDTELAAFIRSHLLSRQHHYCKAQWRFSGEHLENKTQISSSIDDFLKNYDFNTRQ